MHSFEVLGLVLRCHAYQLQIAEPFIHRVVKVVRDIPAILNSEGAIDLYLVEMALEGVGAG